LAAGAAPAGVHHGLVQARHRRSFRHRRRARKPLLLKQGKSELLNTLRSVLPSYASCIYIRQPAPLGLGHAVLCAKPAVGEAPFFVHLADDLIDAKEACLKQMADRYSDGSIVATETVPKDQTDKYGIVKTGGKNGDLLRVEQIVEKPKPDKAPSNLAVVGRYLLTPRVFAHLEQIGEGAGGEIQLTDGIARLMKEEPVYAYNFEGKRFDCGSKLGYLQANVEYALAHKELKGNFKAYLKKLAQDL
jgi:UTP--glucose-1-phosphate uridylyltransferase